MARDTLVDNTPLADTSAVSSADEHVAEQVLSLLRQPPAEASAPEILHWALRACAAVFASDVPPEAAEQEVCVLEQWLDDEINEGDCDEVREQLIAGFYQRLGFHCDWQHFFGADRTDVQQVLQSRQGNPVALGIILLSLGRALGLDVEAVCFPGQLFLSFAGLEGEVYIDAANGERLDWHAMEVRLRGAWGNSAVLEESYLQPSSSHDVLRRLLKVAKAALMHEQRLPEALACSEQLLALFPDDPALRRDRGLVYALLGCHQLAAEDFDYFMAQCPEDPLVEIVKLQHAMLDLSPPALH
ncbi:MAG: SirB1 family protein [Aeromonas sp.]